MPLFGSVLSHLAVDLGGAMSNRTETYAMAEMPT